MDTTDVMGNGVGGGEVLQFWGNAEIYNPNSPYLNNALIRQYDMIPWVILGIIAIIIFIMIRVLMNMYGLKSLKKGKGIISELEYVEMVRKRDAQILRYNKFIARLVNIVEHTVFRHNPVNKEYLEYNLERANIKIPGGSRYMKAEEWNAIIISLTSAVVAVSAVVALTLGFAIGGIMAITAVILASTMPMTYLRQTVKMKDEEIVANFADFYLMLHYVILAGSKTPLNGIMRSYAKTTDSAEMKQMVDVCTHYIDTYGEFEGARYISRAYREIPIMGKLMRLIRQANQGGDVEAELMGFRKELLEAKRYAIEKRTDKLINRARASFNLLMPILFQAILSAMSIYLSDMGLITTFV